MTADRLGTIDRLRDPSHMWPSVDRILIDAYNAGANGDALDLIAARKKVIGAALFVEPVGASQPAAEAEAPPLPPDEPETWRQAYGAPRFEVSTLGRVRTASTGNVLKTGRRTKQSRYLSVGLKSTDGSNRTRPIHRLVAETFLGYRDGLEVNHKDGNRTNNALSNLEWVSQPENNWHSTYVLGHNSGDPVIAVHLSGECRTFATMHDAERDLGLWRDGVRRCLQGNPRWAQCRGWRFLRYSDIPAVNAEPAAAPTPEGFSVEVRPVVVADAPDACALRLVIGCQSFNIGPDYCEDREEAEFFATQIRHALSRLTQQEGGRHG